MPNDPMTCCFKLLKLSSCHSSECSGCSHCAPGNICDSIKDTDSRSHVNKDRCHSVFLRNRCLCSLSFKDTILNYHSLLA